MIDLSKLRIGDKVRHADIKLFVEWWDVIYVGRTEGKIHMVQVEREGLAIAYETASFGDRFTEVQHAKV